MGRQQSLDWTGLDWTGLDWTGLVDWNGGIYRTDALPILKPTLLLATIHNALVYIILVYIYL